MRHSLRIQHQQGFSLVELMVAGAISLILSLVIIQIMTSSGESAARSDGAAQAQETGRFTLSWLVSELRRAGYTPDFNQERIAPFANVCVGNAEPPDPGANCTFNSSSGLDLAQSSAVPNADVQSDRIALRRTFSTTSGRPRDAEDCTGRNLAGILADGAIIVDVYWVERNSDDSDEDAYDDVMKCVSYNDATNAVIPGSSQQVIASGVESLQVLYGESTTESAKDVVRYVEPVDLNNGTVGEEMSNVMAVRVAILARSFSEEATPLAQRSYILLDADPFTFNDRINRQVLVTTVFASNY
jgi:type IV pilus assembly protein PilW